VGTAVDSPVIAELDSRTLGTRLQLSGTEQHSSPEADHSEMTLFCGHLGLSGPTADVQSLMEVLDQHDVAARIIDLSYQNSPPIRRNCQAGPAPSLLVKLADGPDSSRTEAKEL
jgi:hypothetical protein